MRGLIENRRMATWWIRYPDLNWPNIDNYEKIKKRAKDLAEANVTTVIIFGCHFRWDWLPWFNLIHDYLATVVEECHKYGMEVFDHYSINLVHRTSTREEFVYSMNNSGPHLPLGPSREAAETWMYNGHYLNEFRMIDTTTRETLYYPQYQGEGFCFRNPDFIEASIKYAKTLVEETHIDGISADDPVHYLDFKSCACEHCLKALKDKTGIDLPDCDDTSFWYNYNNPAWMEWIKLRAEAPGYYLKKLREALPENFILTSCGAMSANPTAGIGLASDARQFLKGINFVNIEMSGNTPPYKKDDMTINNSISTKISLASHHLAAAREKNVRCFGTTYTHHPESSKICWAINKATGSDCWISTLKQRLGLPDHILDTLPDEAELAKEPFTYEKEHEYLFKGESVPQLAVYFSYETRNNTLFGARVKGYFSDFRDLHIALSENGISSHTVFDIPKDTKAYPLIVIVSPLKMTDNEKSDLRNYLKIGGKAIICGPADFDNCISHYNFPTAGNKKGAEFHIGIKGTSNTKRVDWILTEEFEGSNDIDKYINISDGLLYNPVRIHNNKNVEDETIDLIKKYMKVLPIEVIEQKGYLINIFDAENSYNMHFIAADYDTDIDHHLDEIRYHRSRCNIINKVEPIGIERIIKIKSYIKPIVYTPFNKEESKIKESNGIFEIELPEKCSYAIFRFNK